MDQVSSYDGKVTEGCSDLTIEVEHSFDIVAKIDFLDEREHNGLNTWLSLKIFHKGKDSVDDNWVVNKCLLSVEKFGIDFVTNVHLHAFWEVTDDL